MKWVPLVNADHIQILTSENWRELGIKTLAFSLEALLIKPGIAVLTSQAPLANFLGQTFQNWIVRPAFDNHQKLKLRSPFDGSIQVFKEEELDSLLSQLKPDQIIESTELKLHHVSDQPLKMALNATCLIGNDAVNLSEHRFREQFALLEESCHCPTCELKLTRAYLHHLWTEVPLLCQRYLAMHNIYNWIPHE